MSSKRAEVHREILRIWLDNKEQSYSWIAKQAKSNRWVVKRTLDRFRETQTIAEKPKIGRPKGARDKPLEKM